jgi:hypothetical protein
MLRERIERAFLFKIRMTSEQRHAAIAKDVDEHSHLFALDAVRWVFERRRRSERFRVIAVP